MNHGEEKQYLARRYLILFLFNALMIGSSFYLLFRLMYIDTGVIVQSALPILGNVIVLSAVCCLIEWFVKMLTTDRVVRRIREASERIASGDFSTRIDLTDMPAFEKDYHAIADDMNRMAEELASTETLQTGFISNISHELKTPLAVVKNYAALLKMPNLPEDKRLEYLDGISRAVDRTATLINNILHLNKLENQNAILHKETFNVSSQIAECLIDYEEIWEQKNLDVHADLEEKLMITADQELMILVWNNLISNAIKFTDPGGVITVTACRKGSWVEASVRDTGCGMDEKTRRHIFDKFYQGDTSHSTEGNGLGLAMVKRIIDLTGGELLVESRLGEGSTFTIRIMDHGDSPPARMFR